MTRAFFQLPGIPKMVCSGVPIAGNAHGRRENESHPHKRRSGETVLAFSGAAERDKDLDLAALVTAYSTVLFRVAQSVLRNHAEAEDVVQDCFVRVMEHRRKLPEVRDLRVWLVRIAWNLALDRRRKLKPEQMDASFTASLPALSVAADVSLHDARHMQAVLRNIDALPKLERQVLLLSALEELSATEIASVTGKSESAVRALLFRARAHLRNRLEKGGHV